MEEKDRQYELVYKQAKALLEDEDHLIANLSNLSSLIHFSFGFWWTGFYFVDKKQLVLGPFQGPLACTRIPYGKGVCGTAWAQGKTIVVPDVEQFPGHIACSSESRSEIVVPIFNEGEVWGELDIDSRELDTFDETDRRWLEKIVSLLKPQLYCYKYPHPAVTADCVVFGIDGEEVSILLIERKNDPYKGHWAFPGGFLNMDEDAETGALRELEEETGMRLDHVTEFGSFSDVHRDPRERVITIAFYAVVKKSDVKGGDDAAQAQWFSLDNVPPLAFDHDLMLRKALHKFKEDNNNKYNML